MVTSLGAGRFPEEKGRRKETGHLSSQDEINVRVGDKGTFQLRVTSSLATTCGIPVSSRRASRTRVPGPIAGRLVWVRAQQRLFTALREFPGVPATSWPPALSLLRQSALPAAGLTRGLEPLSCPLAAIQGKPRGSRRSPRASAAVQMRDT